MAQDIDLTKIGLIIQFADKNKPILTCETEQQARYKLSDTQEVYVALKRVTYTKKIYEPSQMHVTLQLVPVADGTTIGSVVTLAKSFASAKVAAYRGSLDNVIADSYFVFKSTPTHEKKGYVSVVLEIYSMDKLLDTKMYSRANVARKLRGEILPDAVARCTYNELVVPVADDDELQYIRWMDGNKQVEFIQPYTVQYNETPYSMLRRTANRCGEFLFFEDGKLHLGLPKYKKPNSSDEQIFEIGSEDDKINFLSISYSEAITTAFGKDIDYYSDNYQKKKQESNGDSTLLIATAGVFVSNLSQMRNAIKDADKKKLVDGYIDIYRQNRLFHDIFEKAKSAYTTTGSYRQSLEKKTLEKRAICGETTGTALETPTPAAIRNAAPEYLHSRYDDQLQHKQEKRKELGDLEKLLKEYQTLTDEMKKLKAEFEKDPLDAAKETAFFEKKAERNHFIEKNGNGDAINAKIQACLLDIKATDLATQDLDNYIKVLESPEATDLQKDEAIVRLNCGEEIRKRLSDKVAQINKDIKEIEEAMELLKEEPSAFKPYRDQDVWNKFTPWKDFCDYTLVPIDPNDENSKQVEKGFSKYNDIWENTLKKGEEPYPISVDVSPQKLKEIAESMSNGNYGELTPGFYEKENDKTKPNVILTKILDEIIKYCDAIINKQTAPQEVPAHTSVYDFEYGNEEYLQTFKEDETGNFGDAYFNACNQDTIVASWIFSKLVPTISGILTSPKLWPMAAGAAGFANWGLGLATAPITLLWLHSHYNEKFITNYKLNGKSVKDSESGASNEVALFTTYNKNTGRTEAGLSKAFENVFYQEMWKMQQQLNDEKISIAVDTAKNQVMPKLGSKIQYDGKKYVVVAIYGERDVENPPMVSKETVEAIPLADDSLCVPPLTEYDRYLKADVQMATVVDDDDPSFLGRVRIRYNWQGNGDEASPWIRVSTPYATKGGGFFFIPQKNDNVMIGYEHGNIERPFVNSSLYGNDIKPPTPIAKAKSRQIISSKNGHFIKFVDKPVLNAAFGGLVSSMDPIIKFLGSLGKDLKGDSPSGSLTISDSFGFYKIACSADKRSVTIASPLGNVSLSAFTGISINAPNGDIKIHGKNVEIKAGNEVKITSGLNVKNAYNLQNPEVPFTFISQVTSGVIGAVGDLIPQAIDLSLIRHLHERVLPPISGALQIKSYRFVLIDSGLKDFAAKGIKANNSLYAHLKKWQGFKKGDFQKGKNKNTDKYGLTAHNIVEMWKQSLSNGLVSIARSVIRESNNWRVDSDQNAVIIAGGGYRTNKDKTYIYKVDTLQPTDNDALQSDNLYSEEADKKTSKPWDYAVEEYDYTGSAENHDGGETKVMSGFKNVMHRVGQFAFFVSTVSIYGILRGVQYGIRRRNEKKFENLTDAAKDFYKANHEENDPLTLEKFLEMSKAEREELINFGKNHNYAEEVNLKEEIGDKAAVDGSDQEDDKSVASLLNSFAELDKNEEPE